MKRAVKITLIIVGVIILILILGGLIFSGFLFNLHYHLLAFSDSCAEECSNSGFASSQCVTFPSLYLANENQCKNNGVEIGMTSDCRDIPRVGGSKHCCCYNK